MNKVLALILVLSFVGCAPLQATRQAKFLTTDFPNQIQKDVVVLPFIDGRDDKEEDLSEFISKNTQHESIVNSLKVRGYKPKLMKMDMSGCKALTNVESIHDIVCLEGYTPPNNAMVMVISLDRYAPPEKKMGLSGDMAVTGVMYSYSNQKIVWKDTLDSKKGGGFYYMFGAGGVVGGWIIKSMGPKYLMRSNLMSVAGELMRSVPPYVKDR